jgi:subtilisin family serine protease
MRRVAAALALAAAGLFPPLTRAGGEERICPRGQVVVLLREGVDPGEAAAAIARRYDGIVCRIYRHSCRGVTLRCAGPAVATALARDPLVRSVEPDIVMHALDDPGGRIVPTGVRRIGAAPAARDAVFAPGRGVGVAILDTGIDLAHPDLDVAGGASFVEGASSVTDENGHGTHVAGIVAARGFFSAAFARGIAGVAPGARLYAVKVLDRDGAGTLSDVIAGLDWVAKNADRVAAANLSLGVRGKSDALRAAIQAVVRAGVVVVVAAGNDGEDIFGSDGVFGTDDDAIPAAYPEVLAVSALADSDGRPGGAGPATGAGPDDTLASFSSHSGRAHERPLVRSPGGAIDLAAPGVDILSCWKDGGYRRASGTSMAAPHVTGLVARLVAARGRDANGDGRIDERDVAAIRQALIDAAEPQRAWRSDGATGDEDGLREGLARAAERGPAAGVAGVRVYATIASAGEANVFVGVRNEGPLAATFDLVVVDLHTGRGIGRSRVAVLGPGVSRTLAVRCDAAALDPRHALRAVAVPPD